MTSQPANLKTSEERSCHRQLHEESFSHSVENLQRIETHISCIILTGEFAYTLKKPVDLGFVDYTTLERRKHFCELEVELNRRFSPDLYLGVVPIFKYGDGLRVGGSIIGVDEPENGPVSQPPEQLEDSIIVDFAVKMRQFPQEAIVASRLDDAALTSCAVEEFGRYIARFHDSIESAIPSLDFVRAKQVADDAMDNFSVLQDPLSGDARFKTLKQLEAWTETEGQRLAAKFDSRLDRGMVRRCHGDLHLKNIIQWKAGLAAFDGIEFNETFQWIDVLSEIAFPVMDFWARGRPDLAWRLMNSYLEETGDYADLDVLRFYLVYRAMVRAKVSWLNPGNHTEARRVEYANSANPEDPFAGPWDKYLQAAEYFALEMSSSLSITHGFSGSGKSTLAIRVIEQEGGVRIRADAERHRLAKKFKTKDKYSLAMSDWVYSHLGELASHAIGASIPVVVDATFLNFKRRQLFESLAKSAGIPFFIIECDASFDELCRRLDSRVDDPSEADIEVLKKQMETHDPLTTAELQYLKKY